MQTATMGLSTPQSLNKVETRGEINVAGESIQESSFFLKEMSSTTDHIKLVAMEESELFTGENKLVRITKVFMIFMYLGVMYSG